MVAYSFKPIFVGGIQRGWKRQTIRAHRRRHARIGEPMQLYTGMRTRRCTKIIPDPVCTRIEDVRFDLHSLEGVYKPPNTNADVMALLGDVTLHVGGASIGGDDRWSFAARDGFLDYCCFPRSIEIMQPFVAMVFFWMQQHGPMLFEGVVIHWERAP